MFRPQRLLTASLVAVWGCFLLACGGCTSKEEKEFGEANAKWDSGNKSEAVAMYKVMLDRNSKNFPNDDNRPIVYQRVIGFEIERGDTASAKALIEKALDKNVELLPSTKPICDLVAQVRADRARREAEEQAKRQAEESRKQAEREADAKRKQEEQVAEAKRKEAEIKRRTEAWRAGIEEKADELAQKIETLEIRLTERQATYNHRVTHGETADPTGRQEIDDLKKELSKIVAELAKVEDTLAAGPPASLFADEKPPTEVPSPTPIQPATGSTAGAGTRPPVGGVVTVPAPIGPKTVYVSGYTKKNGTYVAPHTRSSPRR